jgi:O-antigen/teichoic acid export membrane protein
MAVRRSAAFEPAPLDISTPDLPRPTAEVESEAKAAPRRRSSALFLRVAQLRRNLDAPFVRNAYSLVGSTLATSLLGVAFWIAAARLFSKEDVGRDAALISTMLFLSSISQLNLTNGFNRFVPTAGIGTRRLVLVGYLAAAATALVASSIFVLGVDLWAPRLGLLQDHWPYALWFVGGTVIWTVFALQDAVLTGLGEARWVLIENVCYGIVKLGLLVSVAAALPVLGVFASWTAPLGVVVVVVNIGIFRRMLPARRHPPLEPVDASMVRRYVGFDMVATIMMSATIGLMPVIVLSIVGPSASAYLYLSWTIAYTLYLVSIGVGMSFVTESARAPERIIELARKMIAHSLRIVAPLAVFVALTAPLVLRVFGPAYSHHATHLLQLLALSAIPNVVTATYLSIARVQRRLSAVIAATGALAVGVLTLSIILVHVIGVAGVGVAWLVSQTALATVLLLGELRTVWLPYVHVDRMRSIISRRSPVPARLVARSPRRDGLADVAVALEDAGLAAEGWAPTNVLEDTAAIRVVAVRDNRDSRDGLLKVATNDYGVEALGREVAALEALHETAPPDVLSVLPRPVRSGSEGRAWTLETRLPGVSCGTPAGVRVVPDLAARMVSLYRTTAAQAQIAEDLPELLELPIAATESFPTSALRFTADATSLARLQDELRSELTGAAVTVARVHGNLWLGNVLAAPDGRTVTGIVNWERSRIDLPMVELMHLVCTTRALLEQRELGGVVRDVISKRHLREDEAELVRTAPGSSELSPRTAVLLMWLRHVHGYAERAAGTRPSDVWLSHNVHQVLESV